MSKRGDTPETRRLDQWLWFARFAKSRTLAARWCAAGAISINGAAVKKANHAVCVGDLVSLDQGSWRRRVRVAGLGRRRGPAAEARLLYDEVEPPAPAPRGMPDWVPLLE